MCFDLTILSGRYISNVENRAWGQELESQILQSIREALAILTFCLLIHTLSLLLTHFWFWCLHMNGWARMHAETKGACQVSSPIVLCPIPLKQALSLNQTPPQQAPRIYLSHLPSPGITGMSNFKVGDKDSNSGPAACSANTLTHRTVLWFNLPVSII